MKKQLLRSVFVITAVWLLICAGYLLFMQRKEIVADRGEKLVLLNEVEQLTKNEDGSNPAQAEIEALRETLKEDQEYERKELDEMIRDVNGQCVSREEYLGNHAYYYSVALGKLEF